MPRALSAANRAALAARARAVRWLLEVRYGTRDRAVSVADSEYTAANPSIFEAPLDAAGVYVRASANVTVASANAVTCRFNTHFSRASAFATAGDSVDSITFRDFGAGASAKSC